MTRKSVVVLSGGMDSACAMWHTMQTGEVVAGVSVDYGQRHSKELDCAARLCEVAGVGHCVVDISQVSSIFGANSLTDETVDVPDGHYASATMAATVVPNRNMLLLSIAVCCAAAKGAGSVVYGAHAGDHPVYPDCREEFVDAMRSAASLCWYEPIGIEAPFVSKTKADIVSLGDSLGVPWGSTWSCYKGGDEHCGTCGTCVERWEAFRVAGVHDVTTYVGDPSTVIV